MADNPAYVQLRAENFTSAENGYEEPEPDVDEEGGELEDELLALFYRRFKCVKPSNSANPPYSYVKNGSQAGDGRPTLRETYDGRLAGGLPITDSDGDLVEIGPDSGPIRRYLLLHLPTAVGNVVQGDSFSLDLVFEAEQVRNNDAPFGGSGDAGPLVIDDQTASPP